MEVLTCHGRVERVLRVQLERSYSKADVVRPFVPQAHVSDWEEPGQQLEYGLIPTHFIYNGTWGLRESYHPSIYYANNIGVPPDRGMAQLEFFKSAIIIP